jgi:hypothetical protein
MLISSVTPQELVDWFHKNHRHGQTILCVLVAPAQSDQEKLAATIRNAYTADAMLGAEVAFLLLHPDAKKIVALGGLNIIPVLQGSTFVSPRGEDVIPHRLLDTTLFRDISSERDYLRQEMADQSARAMARFAPEFMQLFTLGAHELPALCILVRGLRESVVVPLQKNWGQDDLLELFGKLQKCALDARDAGRDYNLLVYSLPERLRGLEQSQQELLAKRAELAKLMDGLLSRHKASEADLTMIADFLAGEDLNSAVFNEIVETLSIGNSERFRKDGRIAKAQRLLDRLATLRDGNGFDSQSLFVVQSVAERAEALVIQRTRLLANIQEIRNGRLVATIRGGDNFSQVERSIKMVERLIGLGQKSAGAIAALAKLKHLFSGLG